MGRVWFTVGITVYKDENVPTVAATLASLAAITAVGILLPAYFVVTAATAGILSVKGVNKTGVYSDGKTLVARGALQTDGVYALTLQNIDGAAPADPPAPAEGAHEGAPAGAPAAPAAHEGAGALEHPAAGGGPAGGGYVHVDRA